MEQLLWRLGFSHVDANLLIYMYEHANERFTPKQLGQTADELSGFVFLGYLNENNGVYGVEPIGKICGRIIERRAKRLEEDEKIAEQLVEMSNSILDMYCIRPHRKKDQVRRSDVKCGEKRKKEYVEYMRNLLMRDEVKK
jgi:hypothetical protein